MHRSHQGWRPTGLCPQRSGGLSTSIVHAPCRPDFGGTFAASTGRRRVLEPLCRSRCGPPLDDRSSATKATNGTKVTKAANLTKVLVIAEQASPSGLIERAESRIGHLVVAPTWKGRRTLKSRPALSALARPLRSCRRAGCSRRGCGPSRVAAPRRTPARAVRRRGGA